jgi:hypothetical protein
MMADHFGGYDIDVDISKMLLNAYNNATAILEDVCVTFDSRTLTRGRSHPPTDHDASLTTMCSHMTAPCVRATVQVGAAHRPSGGAAVCE